MAKEKKPRRPWKLRQKLTLIAACVILAAGAGFLCFPYVSNFFGQQKAKETIEIFDKSEVNTIDENGEPDSPEDNPDAEAIEKYLRSKTYREALENGEIDAQGYVLNESGARVSYYPVTFKIDLDRLYRDSLEYNHNLINNQGTVDTSDYTRAALPMGEYGLSYVYGYLSAPYIGLNMPIYLGANDLMMSYGAAHLSGTSLPVDEKNTNVAIAGHTGYIGRIFFDNIRNLRIGDTVTITNYWEEIDYTVIDYKIIDFDNTEDIYIQPERQLLTLITCTDSRHRYVVICEKK